MSLISVKLIPFDPGKIRADFDKGGFHERYEYEKENRAVPHPDCGTRPLYGCPSDPARRPPGAGSHPRRNPKAGSVCHGRGKEEGYRNRKENHRRRHPGKPAGRRCPHHGRVLLHRGDQLFQREKAVEDRARDHRVQLPDQL